MADDDLILDTTRPDLVERGPDGDPLPQGTRMIEKESYERVIEGMKMAADAAARLVRMESEHADYWRRFHHMLDGVRRLAMSISGLDGSFKETAESWGGEVGVWRDARMRFREGIKQAAGGARQMATCHRGDLAWSRMANTLEQMQAKLNRITNHTMKQATLGGRLWVPDGGSGWVQ